MEGAPTLVVHAGPPHHAVPPSSASRRYSPFRLRRDFVGVRAVCFSAPGNHASDRPTRLEVWDLQLGTQLEALPDEFVDYACGTNGGPPATPLHPRRAGQRRPAGTR